MNFTPEQKNVKQMFSSYPIMKIPNFQRDYSWEKKYYAAFFNDVLEGLVVDNEKIINSDYFIGVMVFAGKLTDEYIDVIDGQQRLTVITVILSVLASKFQSIDEQGLANATFKYVKTLNDYDQPIPKLKSITAYPYFEAYVQSIEKDETLCPASEEEENIKETYKYFESVLEEIKLRNRLRIAQSVKYREILIAIRDQILLMNIISILTNDKESAYEIFEILNAKGKNLAAIDLIKNTIYSKFHADSNSKDKTIEVQWERIKKILRDRDQNIGFITFYRHFWISKYNKTTNVKLYDSFNKEIKPNKDDYENFVNTVKKEANTYLKIVSPNRLDYNNKKEYFWLIQSLEAIEKTFGVSQARIALLALFDVKERGLISTKYFKKTITYIENFIFSYSTLLKNQANIYESRFSKFAIKLRKSGSKEQSNDIIKEYLFEQFRDKFPQKDEFVFSFKHLQYSKSYNINNTVTKYVLNKISSSFDDRDIFHDESSVEHIINEDISNKITLNIGNLICLEEKINNEADNLSFDEKVKIYSKSKYHQVNRFCKDYNVFDTDYIDQRAEKLAEYYYENIILKSKNL
jgi:hypothetical protein